MSKKIVLIIVPLVLMCSFLMILDEEDVEAADAELVNSGSCGTNLRWSYYSDGLLTLTGEGNMSSYSQDDVPWYQYMNQITSISIGPSVMGISQYAFTGAAITNVVIPDSVQTIGRSAFANCASLVTISIGTGVTDLARSAFQNCTSVVRINFDAVAATGDYYSGGKYYTPFQGCGSNTASGVSVTFSNDVTSIASHLFRGVSSLKSVSMGSNVSSIGSYSFYNTGITSLNIPSKVTSIGEYAFAGTDLTSISIPDNVISIGRNAFSDCNSARTITIGSGVTEWNRSVFQNCTSVSRINYNAVAASEEFYSGGNYYVPFDGCGSNITSGVTVVFGDEVTSITSHLFRNVDDVKSITLGSNVSSIGSYSFYNTGITSLTIPARVTTIGERAFSYSALTSIDIPDNVTTLGDLAFADCTNVKTITIGTGITTWNENIFQNSESVTTINYNPIAASQNFYRSGNYYVPFYGCGNSIDPMTINIGATVTSIPTYLFASTNAKEVVIGPAVESIGERAFQNNPYLTTITFTSVEKPSIGASAFSLGQSNQPVSCDVLSRFGNGFLDSYGNSSTTFTYGTYHGEMYTVKFVTNCDQTTPDQSVESGYRVTIPELKNQGFKIENWYTDSALTERFDPSVPVTGNLTLYAKWVALQTFTIHFEVNGGNAMEPIQMTENDPMNSLPTPTRDGYNFIGWYYDSDLTDPVEEGDVSTGSVTLYASWTEAPSFNVDIGQIPTIIVIVVFVILALVIRVGVTRNL